MLIRQRNKNYRVIIRGISEQEKQVHGQKLVICYTNDSLPNGYMTVAALMKCVKAYELWHTKEYPACNQSTI
jgi:hypothetical protein